MIQKAKIKIMTDILMTAVMLFLMGYQFWGEAAHEWAGAGIFLLFIIHHILNASWYRGFVKGKYTLTRILMIAINFLLLAAMLALMYSSFVLSRHVFAFLPVAGGDVAGQKAPYPGRLLGICPYRPASGASLGDAYRLPSQKNEFIQGIPAISCYF